MSDEFRSYVSMTNGSDPMLRDLAEDRYLFRSSKCLIGVVDNVELSPAEYSNISSALEAQWGAQSVLLMIISENRIGLQSKDFYNFITLNYVSSLGMKFSYMYKEFKFTISSI